MNRLWLIGVFGILWGHCIESMKNNPLGNLLIEAVAEQEQGMAPEEVLRRYLGAQLIPFFSQQTKQEQWPALLDCAPNKSSQPPNYSRQLYDALTLDASLEKSGKLPPRDLAPWMRFLITMAQKAKVDQEYLQKNPCILGGGNLLHAAIQLETLTGVQCLLQASNLKTKKMLLQGLNNEKQTPAAFLSASSQPALSTEAQKKIEMKEFLSREKLLVDFFETFQKTIQSQDDSAVTELKELLRNSTIFFNERTEREYLGGYTMLEYILLKGLQQVQQSFLNNNLNKGKKNNHVRPLTLTLAKVRAYFAHAKNAYGCSFVHWAAYCGDLDAIKYYTEAEGFSQNLANGAGLLPIHFAAKKGHLAVVEHILKNFPDALDAVTNTSETPLALAVKNKCPKIVAFLQKELKNNVTKSEQLPDKRKNDLAGLNEIRQFLPTWLVSDDVPLNLVYALDNCMVEFKKTPCFTYELLAEAKKYNKAQEFYSKNPLPDSGGNNCTKEAQKAIAARLCSLNFIQNLPDKQLVQTFKAIAMDGGNECVEKLNSLLKNSPQAVRKSLITNTAISGGLDGHTPVDYLIECGNRLLLAAKTAEEAQAIYKKTYEKIRVLLDFARRNSKEDVQALLVQSSGPLPQLQAAICFESSIDGSPRKDSLLHMLLDFAQKSGCGKDYVAKPIADESLLQTALLSNISYDTLKKIFEMADEESKKEFIFGRNPLGVCIWDLATFCKDNELVRIYADWAKEHKSLCLAELQGYQEDRVFAQIVLDMRPKTVTYLKTVLEKKPKSRFTLLEVEHTTVSVLRYLLNQASRLLKNEEAKKMKTKSGSTWHESLYIDYTIDKLLLALQNSPKSKDIYNTEAIKQLFSPDVMYQETVLLHALNVDALYTRRPLTITQAILPHAPARVFFGKDMLGCISIHYVFVRKYISNLEPFFKRVDELGIREQLHAVRNNEGLTAVDIVKKIYCKEDLVRLGLA